MQTCSLLTFVEYFRTEIEFLVTGAVRVATCIVESSTVAFPGTSVFDNIELLFSEHTFQSGLYMSTSQFSGILPEMPENMLLVKFCSRYHDLVV